MSRERKFFISLAAYICLGIFLCIPVTTYTDFGSNYMEVPSSGQKITLQELEVFLPIWEELVAKDVAGYSSLQLSYKNDSVAEGLPNQLVRWLTNRGWSVERFFYNEQRIRSLAGVAFLQNSIKAKRKLSGKMDLGQNMERKIEEQEKLLRQIKADEDELELIKANLFRINNVMDPASSSQP